VEEEVSMGRFFVREPELVNIKISDDSSSALFLQWTSFCDVCQNS
jgi:hypothetical protein